MFFFFRDETTYIHPNPSRMLALCFHSTHGDSSLLFCHFQKSDYRTATILKCHMKHFHNVTRNMEKLNERLNNTERLGEPHTVLIVAPLRGRCLTAHPVFGVLDGRTCLTTNTRYGSDSTLELHQENGLLIINADVPNFWMSCQTE